MEPRLWGIEKGYRIRVETPRDWASMVTSKSLGIIPHQSLGNWETSNLSPHGGKMRVRRGEEGEEFYRYEVLESGFQGHGLGARSEAGLEGPSPFWKRKHTAELLFIKYSSEALDPLIT